MTAIVPGRPPALRRRSAVRSRTSMPASRTRRLRASSIERPGRIAAGMKDPRPGVGGLSSRGDLAVDRVERNTVAYQIRDPSRGFVAKGFRGRPGPRARLPHGSCPSGEGRRIVGSDRGSDTALSVPSGRLFEPGFRDQRRSQAEFSTSERDVESRDARTDNERATRGVAHVPRERSTGYSDFSTRAERRIPFRPPGTVAESEPRSPRPWENVVSVREDVPLERELLGRLENGTGLRSVGVTDLISLRRAYYRDRRSRGPDSRRPPGSSRPGSIGTPNAGRTTRPGRDVEARVRRDGLVGRIDILADLPIEVKTSSSLVSPSELPAYRPDHIEQLGMSLRSRGPSGRSPAHSRSRARARSRTSRPWTWRSVRPPGSERRCDDGPTSSGPP